jgi:hypothetical protein
MEANVAQASCLWGRRASRLLIIIFKELKRQARCPVSPQARRLCYG